MSVDTPVLMVGDVGTVLQITKQPADKTIRSINFQDYLVGRNGVTLVSCAGLAVTPADAGAPTPTLGTVAGNAVPLTVDAGDGTWNSDTGKGRITFVGTMSDGEKKEVDIAVTIEDV